MDKKEAFVNTIKSNEGLIYKVTSLYTDTTEDQKDLYQEIVFQLWKSFDTFKGKSKFSTWMYRIALNTAIAFLNKGNKSVPQEVLDFNLLQIAVESNDIIGERIATLYAHIKRLNATEKAIVLLYLEGKQYVEIAEITGFTKTNIGTRLNRIKDKLRSQINT